MTWTRFTACCVHRENTSEFPIIRQVLESSHTYTRSCIITISIQLQLLLLQPQTLACPSEKQILRLHRRRYPVPKCRAPENLPVGCPTILDGIGRLTMHVELWKSALTFPFEIEISSYDPGYRATGCLFFRREIMFSTITDACSLYFVTCFCSSHSMASPPAKIRG